MSYDIGDGYYVDDDGNIQQYATDTTSYQTDGYTNTTDTTSSSGGFNLADIGKLLGGTSSYGMAGQLAGLAGIGTLLNKIMGGGSGGFAGYRGGIPKYTASRQQYAVPTDGKVSTYKPSDTEIRDYALRPGINDAMVARGMNEFGISPDRMANIMQLPTQQVQSRYQTAMGPNYVARRPGSGGVTYFTPMTYSTVAPLAAAPETTTTPTTQPTVQAKNGGIVTLANGGSVKHFAIGDLVKGELEQAYAAQDYDTVNKLVSQNKITDADVRGTWGMDTSGLAGLGINLYQPPAAVDANQLDYFGNPKNTQVPVYENTYSGTTTANPWADAPKPEAQPDPAYKEIFDYFTRNQNLVQNKDYNTIASDMYTREWTPEMVARATGTDVADVTSKYNQTYGAFDRATQEDLVNQKYKKKFGLTDEQLGQRYFGAPMDTRENRLSSSPLSNAYEKYQEEMMLTGRRDAPAGTQYRAKAVYEPGAFDGRGVIKLYDTATGEHLTNSGYNAYELNDKFAVDPASYRKAVTQMYEASGKPAHMKDDYTKSLGYKPRNVAAATDEYLTKPLKNLTVGDLKAKYDDKNPDNKTNVFWLRPMQQLLMSKGMRDSEATNYLHQFLPVAGLVDWAEISRSKDPVKAVIGTLNTLQSKGLVNRDPNTGPLSRVGDIKRDTAGNKIGRLIPDSTPLSALGFKRLASGGISSLAPSNQLSNLGGYSDGGQLLRGPGDGVSDDIPATIGGRQPARLADGEFVVPARIVSELGNGSTDAGARKLYAMMDRIKSARAKAKNIAANTKADKHLPA